MIKSKKTPERKCLGCNEMKQKNELLRVVRDKEGSITIDKTGKSNGRGAYVCKNVECFKKCRKGRRLEKAFSQEITEEIYNNLESMVADG